MLSLKKVGTLLEFNVTATRSRKGKILLILDYKLKLVSPGRGEGDSGRKIEGRLPRENQWATVCVYNPQEKNILDKAERNLISLPSNPSC